MAIISAEGVGKSYRVGEIAVAALSDVTFRIEPASFAAFVGPSGSGKSTLLNLIGCLDHPSAGRLEVLGTDIATLGRRDGAVFRGRNIGFVFQDFNLMPVLTAYENVEYPLVMVQRWPETKRRARVMSLLESVGVADQAHKYPDQLSGGQKQRVAVARALAPNTQLVLADEPTANLDHETAARVIALMRRMRDDFGVTFLFSTHDPKVMAAAETIFHLEDGRLIRREAAAEGGLVHV